MRMEEQMRKEMRHQRGHQSGQDPRGGVLLSMTGPGGDPWFARCTVELVRHLCSVF